MVSFPGQMHFSLVFCPLRVVPNLRARVKEKKAKQISLGCISRRRCNKSSVLEDREKKEIGENKEASCVVPGTIYFVDYVDKGDEEEALI